MNIPFTILAVSVGILIGLLIRYLGRAVSHKINETENLKYEFITIIAHKFRTPLTQIKWLSEALVAEEQDSYKKQSLQEVGRSTQQLIDLTGTLVELTDSDSDSQASYTFERTNVCDLVRSVADTFKNTFHEKNLFLAINCANPDLFANIDKPRMEFVIQTLLQNSVTYSPPGRNVEVTISADSSRVVITVHDNGIGIEAKDIPKIFTKFFRTPIAKQTDTEGFGVGLYLVRAIVRRHKGSIEVASPGLAKGATFQITIPEVK
ncbi:MAG: HAMP domain-containing sensor histidine kinase [Patescibacteria group bacterium]